LGKNAFQGGRDGVPLGTVVFKTGLCFGAPVSVKDQKSASGAKERDMNLSKRGKQERALNVEFRAGRNIALSSPRSSATVGEIKKQECNLVLVKE